MLSTKEKRPYLKQGFQRNFCIFQLIACKVLSGLIFKQSFMKSKNKKSEKKPSNLRGEILKSMLHSFRIEGIHISESLALASLKKVELTLGK